MLDIITIREVKLNIGQWIKMLRKKEQLSQQELADKLGLSRITVQNFESGKNATLDTLLKALQYLQAMEGLQSYISNEIRNNSYESLY